jgi:hypothetical protein
MELLLLPPVTLVVEELVVVEELASFTIKISG